MKRLFFTLLIVTLFTLPIYAESEEPTTEDILNDICEYAGFEFSLDDKWQAASDIIEQDDVRIAVLVGKEDDGTLPIMTVYVGKHDHDKNGTFDSMIGFFTKSDREKGTEILTDEWPVMDYNGNVYYYYNEDKEVISVLSVNFPDSLLEFSILYPAGYTSDENLKTVADNITTIAVNLMQPFLDTEEE